MRKSLLPGILLLTAFVLIPSCVDGSADPSANDPEANGVPANRANKPFYVAVFDHVPDEGEIQADFERFLLASRETSTAVTHDPVPKQDPQLGQKLVRIDATTGTQEFAGTHEGSLFRFRGTWELDSGATESRDFALGTSNADNLDRGTVGIFYYLFDVSSIRDKFLKGQIVTISQNGWYCVSIKLYETNNPWVTRGQHLPFAQWVDYPANSPSDSKPATDSSWLKYR